MKLDSKINERIQVFIEDEFKIKMYHKGCNLSYRYNSNLTPNSRIALPQIQISIIVQDRSKLVEQIKQIWVEL